MPDIIKDNQVVADEWTLLAEKDADQIVPEGNHIVPLVTWLAQQDTLSQRSDIGVWLDSDEAPEPLAGSLDHLPLVAVNFPAFADGRGYSYARLLRERYGFTGELRAIGEVLRDQLFYLHRCGFNAFALRSDLDAQASLAHMQDFTESYQVAVDQPVPLFRRRA